MRRPQGYTILLALWLLWCAGILAPAFLRFFGIFPFGEVCSRALYAPVCHQDPQRTLSLAGVPLAVCTRCSAVYFSGLLVVLLAPGIRRLIPFRLSVGWLSLCLAPMAIDVALGFLTAWQGTTLSRLLTGISAGIALAVFLIPAWEDMWEQIGHLKTYTPPSAMERTQ